MSLLAAVADWEARRGVDETRPETPMKQPERVFQDQPARSAPVKHEKPQKTAKNEACFTVSSPRARNSETLPDEVLSGLDKLGSGWVPRRVKDSHVWREVVADALRLRDDGWAVQALAMSWSPLDLFGVGEWFEGVAVELRGRPILALLADTRDTGGAHAAFVLDGGDGRRNGINRRNIPDGTKLLWEMQ